MISWKNLDTLTAYQELLQTERVDLVTAMSGEAGAERVKNYTVPMGEGLDFNYGARPVDDKILTALKDKLNAVENPATWPFLVFEDARVMMKEVVRDKVRTFGSAGRI